MMGRLPEYVQGDQLIIARTCYGEKQLGVMTADEYRNLIKDSPGFEHFFSWNLPEGQRLEQAKSDFCSETETFGGRFKRNMFLW